MFQHNELLKDAFHLFLHVLQEPQILVPLIPLLAILSFVCALCRLIDILEEN